MTKLFLRPAIPDDVQLLFDWTNDPAVRAHSFSTAEIPYEEHERWFSRLLASDAAKLFILMEGERPIGQIRLELQRGAWRISYSVATLYRGQGYGRILLELMENELIALQEPVHHLTADVKADNIASQRLFERLGYTCRHVKGEDDAYHYEKSLSKTLA